MTSHSQRLIELRIFGYRVLAQAMPSGAFPMGSVFRIFQWVRRGLLPDSIRLESRQEQALFAGHYHPKLSPEVSSEGQEMNLEHLPLDHSLEI